MEKFTNLASCVIRSSGALGSQPLARHTVQTSGWTTIPGGWKGPMMGKVASRASTATSMAAIHQCFQATTRLQDFRGNPIEKPPTFEGNYPPLVPLFSFFEHQMCCTQPWSQLKTVPKNLSYPHGRMVWVKSCGHKRGWFPIKTHGLNQANRENRVRSL